MRSLFTTFAYNGDMCGKGMPIDRMTDNGKD